MSKGKVIISLMAFLIFLQIILFYKDADAQMRVVYPKRFSLEGFIELTFKDYNTQIKNRYDRESGYSVFQHRYSLGAKGYIYHPKLAVFSSRVTFTYNNIFNSTTGFEPDSRNINYELSVIFLPYRPISLTTYATVNDFTYEGLNGNSPYDVRIVNYGALLGINLKNLPAIRFEYYHMDITPTGSQQSKGKTTNDSYYLNIRGTWLKMKTQYSMNFGFSDIKSPFTSFQSKFIDLYANTDLKKFSWINFFRYLDQDSLKMYGIYTNLQFNRLQRFFSDYYYSYEHYEHTFKTSTIETDKQDMRGSFSYIFQRNLQASLSLHYGIIKENDEKWKYYNVNTSLHYARPIKSYYLTSFYRFILKHDEQRTSYTEHTASLEITSKSYKWGRFFASYYFTTIDGTFKFKETEAVDSFETTGDLEEGEFKGTTHNLVLGLKGRAFTRASWSLEAQYVHSNSTKKRPKRFFDFDEEFSESDMLETEQKKDYYVLVGELFYPVGRKGTMLTLRAGSDFGKLDSRSFDKKYYELHFSWPVTRKFRLLTWWREAWYDIENRIDRKVREYSLIAKYRIGRIFLDGEYWVREEKEESHYRKDTRLILKAKRPF